MTTRRDFLTGSAAVLAFALPAPNLLAAKERVAMTINGSDKHDGRHDFDFFHGRWQVHNRRLSERHVGSDQWDEFAATLDCRPILDGLGNIDEYRSADVHGISLRLFDPHTKQWSDRWASTRDGALGAPALGAFANGVGRFLGHDQDGDRAILARTLWSDITADSFTWEQAASLDDGVTWETNWVMHITRTR
ncbi:MAG TPA: hypothetical protein VGQ93_09925 [Lysobacter sp.]|jgi:hypothetical protein|nr:hypothetical protein [Lysobacter sp.]